MHVTARQRIQRANFAAPVNHDFYDYVTITKIMLIFGTYHLTEAPGRKRGNGTKRDSALATEA
jgi:hypothetical protein